MVVVSHTKSGRTWLRVMMSHLYHLRYGIPEQEILKFDNLHALNAAIPRIYFTRDTENPTFSLRGGVQRVTPDKKIVFMVRDPRDVAVSFYFHVLKRASAGELDRKGIPPDVKSMNLYDFVIHEELGIPRIIAYMNRWHREMSVYPESLLVKYEELKVNAEEVLGRVMRFIGPEFDQRELAKAVEFASFESLARKEAQGFFATGRLKPKEEADRNTYKVRRGKVGGYREDFTPEQIAAMDELVRTRLVADYGYT